MSIAMNTLKGTHIDFPKKWGIRKVMVFAFLTNCLIACVCTPQQITAQEADVKSAYNGLYTGFANPELGMLWYPVGQHWLVSGIQRSFGLKELDEPWISAGTRRSHYTLALGGSTLGWDQMRQWVLASSASYTTDRFQIAVGAKYSMIRLRYPYRNDGAFTLDTGIRKMMHNTIYATASVQNILGSKWRVGRDPVERKLHIDLSGYILPDVLVEGGFGVSDQFSADYNTNVLWKANNIFVFNVGLGSMPSRVEMGISLSNRGWVAGSKLSNITNSSIGWRQNHWLGRVSE